MMNALLDMLPMVLRHAGDSPEARQQAVFAAYSASVGAQVRNVSSPLRVERKTLLVAVTDATWQKQMKRMSGQVLFRVNSLLGAPVITALDFVVNPALVQPPPARPPEIVFTAPELQAAALREPAERIPDPSIRDAFLRAAGKCLERRAK